MKNSPWNGPARAVPSNARRAFAGRLIEECGLRGFTVGGAQISEKHCGFVINKGGATCADVVALTEKVKQIVLEKTGFVLEREIRVVK